MLLRAAGHAACYGAVVLLVEIWKGNGDFTLVGVPAMGVAFLVWLLVVGRRRPSILRLVAVGYATVAPAAMLVLLGFGASTELTLRLGVLILPLVVIVTGTIAAMITVGYGLGLRLLESPVSVRKSRERLTRESGARSRKGGRTNAA
jgi:hypothetical protein